MKGMQTDMNEKIYDVTALGELLIDFTENGKSAQGNPLFEANPGGAPCNVLAMLTKLGHKTAFIGKVGDDFFGKQLREAITEVGIDSTGLLSDPEIHTTLAMVHTYPDGPDLQAHLRISLVVEIRERLHRKILLSYLHIL